MTWNSLHPHGRRCVRAGPAMSIVAGHMVQVRTILGRLVRGRV